MKAIGNYILVKAEVVKAKRTEGGLMIAKNNREDVRYIEGLVKSVGDILSGIKEGDTVYFDRTAGNPIGDLREGLKIISIRDIVAIK